MKPIIPPLDTTNHGPITVRVGNIVLLKFTPYFTLTPSTPPLYLWGLQLYLISDILQVFHNILIRNKHMLLNAKDLATANYTG